MYEGTITNAYELEGLRINVNKKLMVAAVDDPIKDYLLLAWKE
jgi:hypothetical protein